MRALPWLSLVAVLASTPARAESYDEALARADAYDAAGHLDAAADALVLLVGEYPQDYALVLRLAWVRYRAGRFADAERSYREALALSNGALDAHLGLGWSLLKQGRKEEAARELRVVLREQPDHAIAKEGLALAELPDVPPFELFPTLLVTGHAYPSHPYKSFGATLGAGATARVAGHLLVGLTYRATVLELATEGMGQGARASTTRGVLQHELHPMLGWACQRWGIAARYAWLDDQSGFSGTSHHVGADLRVSPFGDVVLSSSWSFYAGLDVGRLELSWRVPLGKVFWIRPAGSVQVAGGQPAGAAAATVGFETRHFGAWLGGKGGDEVRPALLTIPFVWNVPERIPFGAWTGVWIPLPDRWALSVSYDVTGLRRTDGLTPEIGAAHLLTLAVARTL